jgi:hypothetical protein
MKPERQSIPLRINGGRMSKVRRLADGRLELLPQPAAEEILLALWEVLAENNPQRLNRLKAKLAEINKQG